MKALLTATPLMALALVGCNGETAPPGGDPNTAAASATVDATAATNECSKVQTSGWHAVVNEFPGPGKPKNPPLVVTGKAHLTSGGWTLSLADRGQTKDIPYTQMLEFVATKAGDASTQPVEDQEVKFTKETPGSVGFVTISCGRMQLARLPVERPQ